MKLTNWQIYQYSNNIIDNFKDIKVYIPAKANFFLQKNIEILLAANQDIEKARIEIGKHYGELDQDNSQYKILPDKIELVNKELEELFSIEQELNIRKFNIDSLGNAEFTPVQLQAIMFMIED